MRHSITQKTDPDCFEISLDGTVAGFAEFVEMDGARVFFHTEIDPAYGGRGLAGEVVRHALDATREAGLRIVPVCPYVVKFMDKNPDWEDLREPATPEILRALRT